MIWKRLIWKILCVAQRRDIDGPLGQWRCVGHTSGRLERGRQRKEWDSEVRDKRILLLRTSGNENRNMKHRKSSKLGMGVMDMITAVRKWGPVRLRRARKHDVRVRAQEKCWELRDRCRLQPYTYNSVGETAEGIDSVFIGGPSSISS